MMMTEARERQPAATLERRWIKALPVTVSDL